MINITELPPITVAHFYNIPPPTPTPLPHTHTHRLPCGLLSPSELTLTSGPASPHLHRCPGEVRGNPRPGSPRRQWGADGRSALHFLPTLQRVCPRTLPWWLGQATSVPPGFPLALAPSGDRPCSGTRKLWLGMTVISRCPRGRGSGNSLSLEQQLLPRPVSWLGQSFRSPHSGFPTSGTSHLPSLPLALMSCPARDQPAMDDFQVPPASTPGGSDLILSWS